MVIVDSTVWIDFLQARVNPQTAWVRRELDVSVAVADLILCEVLQGIRGRPEFDRVLSLTKAMPIFDTGGAGIAVAAAENYRFLRSKGITIRKTIDCIIATYCIERDHILLHRDRDFDPFEEQLGLRVLHP